MPPPPHTHTHTTGHATGMVLTIAEDARRGDLDGGEGAQMVEHHAPVAVHAGIVDERPDVDGLTRVTDARTYSDRVVTCRSKGVGVRG